MPATSHPAPLPVEPVMTSDLQTATDQLARSFSEATGLTIQVGYIGNLEPWGDRRIWYVWVANARHLNGNLLSIGDPSDGHLCSHAAFEAALVAALRRPDAHPADVRDVWGEIVTTREQSAELIEAVR